MDENVVTVSSKKKLKSLLVVDLLIPLSFIVIFPIMIFTVVIYIESKFVFIYGLSTSFITLFITSAITEIIALKKGDNNGYYKPIYTITNIAAVLFLIAFCIFSLISWRCYY